ncbi:DUF3120 domain-containing protein [Myxacorys almedinensis]|uniref:DUF3120 domain-containing protein n=1 Tax=Myxacorys almedinensis A TaxID=2690445 RepID=A0A8J7Z4L5_9CYAN|nr:DUF3120 domain-containing protein [Myxacorys almedinensis]NDJ19689.1 DUF3120 domain-containing protein [Myxacorys almedinensis A]
MPHTLALETPVSPPSQISTALLIFGGATFLVSVPVFFEAPLVRSLPFLSLALTGFWAWLSLSLASKPQTQIWGDLLTGFTWTWLAGSLYWGWMRWEPGLHLPIEAIALPIALWGITQNWCKIGNFFYLGSLFGTVVTDVYFYLANLIPFWKQLMQVEPEAVRPIFQQALVQMNTPWGLSWVVLLAGVLLSVGIFSFRLRTLHWFAFSGAVLATIFVDSLFWVAALFA